MLLIGLGGPSARYVALGGRSNVAAAARRIGGRGADAIDPAGVVRLVGAPPSHGRQRQGCLLGYPM